MNADWAHQELLMLLRNAVEEIDRAKQRQWRDVYHILVAQGALIGLYVAILSQKLNSWDHLPCLFFIATLVLTALGCWLVWASMGTLENQRKLIENGYYPKIDSSLREVLESNLGRSVHRKTYPVTFISLLVLAGGFASILVVVLDLK